MSRQATKQRFHIVGEHPRLNQAVDIALKIAPTEVTVLIVGENGTGKDVFSKIIHQNSTRKHKPFIAINCGAIPEGTIDSELFGHEKGSFTSAYDSRKGYFEEADGGVIFLDEIAEMPLATQSRLLRVLENGEYLRVGSSKVQKTNVRVVAATNKNLLEAIRRGKFREDLYFRLNTVTIQVPPLRERGSDIELLYKYFAAEFGQRYGREPLMLSDDARRMLYQYNWPGNIRELRNFVEKLTVLVADPIIDGETLKGFLPLYESMLPTTRPVGFDRPDADAPPVGAATSADMEGLALTLQRMERDMAEIKRALVALAQGGFRPPTGAPTQPAEPHYGIAPVAPQPSQPVYTPQLMSPAALSYPATAYTQPEAPYPAPPQLPRPLDVAAPSHRSPDESLSIEVKEKDLIHKALIKHHRNRKKAAQELGISERTLYRKIKSYGLDEGN